MMICDLLLALKQIGHKSCALEDFYINCSAIPYTKKGLVSYLKQ